MQVTPENVLQIRNALRGEAQRLGDLLRLHDYNLTVRPPGGDPVSGPAAELFNEKIAAVKKQCVGYINMLDEAGLTLEQNARAYRYTDHEIKDSLAAYKDARRPRWNAQAQSRDAIQELPKPMQALMQPSQPPPPTPPPLAGMFNGA